MKLHMLLAVALFLPLLPACTSTPEADSAVPCRCGTPLGDLEGCAHADCLAGRNNPDNPDCVCGTLEIPAAGGK